MKLCIDCKHFGIGQECNHPSLFEISLVNGARSRRSDVFTYCSAHRAFKIGVITKTINKLMNLPICGNEGVLFEPLNEAGDTVSQHEKDMK